MGRYTTDSFTSASVPAHSSLAIDRIIGSNFINLVKIKATPSVGSGTSQLQIFKSASLDISTLAYNTVPFSGSLIDPIEDDGGGIIQERNEGFVAPYEDADASLRLHLTITNNYNSAQTYAISIKYEVAFGGSALSGPPGSLIAQATASGLNINSTVIALLNTAGISASEFRAFFVAVGSPLLASVDMTTPAEGGTFIADGVTKLIVTTAYANYLGSSYKFASANPGRWYFAWKLTNTSGSSAWTDGNAIPSLVTQFVDTTSTVNADTVPPSGWTVVLEYGSTPNTVVVRATRPAIGGTVINYWAVQIKDGSTGAWRLLDANTGAAATHYDGSAQDHTMSGNVIIQTVPGGMGSAAVGDLVLIDVRGGAFDVQYCTGGIVASVGANSVTLYGLPDPMPQVQTGLRIKIVEPSWQWNSEGYLGSEANHGYWDSSMSPGESIYGDLGTQVFVSPPINIPVGLAQPEARVFFTTDYSTGDNAAGHSSGVAGAANSYEVALIDAATVVVDASLINGPPKKVFYLLTTAAVGALRTIGNPSNAMPRQPIQIVIRQSAAGGNNWTLDTKYRTTAGVPVIPSTVAKAIDYLGVVYDSHDDMFDVVSFVPGFAGS